MAKAGWTVLLMGIDMCGIPNPKITVLGHNTTGRAFAMKEIQCEFPICGLW